VTFVQARRYTARTVKHGKPLRQASTHKPEQSIASCIKWVLHCTQMVFACMQTAVPGPAMAGGRRGEQQHQARTNLWHNVEEVGKQDPLRLACACTTKQRGLKSSSEKNTCGCRASGDGTKHVHVLLTTSRHCETWYCCALCPCLPPIAWSSRGRYVKSTDRMRMSGTHRTTMRNTIDFAEVSRRSIAVRGSSTWVFDRSKGCTYAQDSFVLGDVRFSA
jgi:hypothetical protein